MFALSWHYLFNACLLILAVLGNVVTRAKLGPYCFLEWMVVGGIGGKGQMSRLVDKGVGRSG